jgi:RNA polymerase sigma-70 factor (ECF subfamily)
VVNPWLVSTGRFKTIARWRRQERLAGALVENASSPEASFETTLPAPIQDVATAPRAANSCLT